MDVDANKITKRKLILNVHDEKDNTFSNFYLS